MVSSGAMVEDAYIASLIANGSNQYTFPFYNELADEDEDNYDGKTDIDGFRNLRRISDGRRVRPHEGMAGPAVRRGLHHRQAARCHRRAHQPLVRAPDPEAHHRHHRRGSRQHQDGIPRRHQGQARREHPVRRHPGNLGRCQGQHHHGDHALRGCAGVRRPQPRQLPALHRCHW